MSSGASSISQTVEGITRRCEMTEAEKKKALEALAETRAKLKQLEVTVKAEDEERKKNPWGPAPF